MYGLPSVRNLIYLAPNNYLDHIEVNSLKIFGFWLISAGSLMYMMLERKDRPDELNNLKDEGY
jgi:hypothetical protein